MEELNQVLTLIGGSSPLVALVAWHMYTQHKKTDALASIVEKQTEAIHGVDKRLAVIENFVEYNTSTQTRRANQ